LEVILYTKEEVQKEIDELKANDEYTRVLHHKEIVETEEETTELTSIYKKYWNLTKASRTPASGKKGDALGYLPDLSGAGVGNMKEMCDLMEFLFANGTHTLKRVKGKGSCLYASIRRSTTIGKECSNTHLRRYLIMRVCLEHEFFFKVLKVALAEEYGQEKISQQEKEEKIKRGELNATDIEDYELPGPFSFCSFLEHIHKRSSWGDKIILLMFSLIWQIRITILRASNKSEIRIRHNLSMKDGKVDMVLVLSGSNHFSGTGKNKLTSYHNAKLYPVLIFLYSDYTSCSYVYFYTQNNYIPLVKYSISLMYNFYTFVFTIYFYFQYLTRKRRKPKRTRILASKSTP